MKLQSVIGYIRAPFIELGEPRLGLVDTLILEREVCRRCRGERR